MELFGEGFEARRNLSDFLHPALSGAPGGAGQELEIVDDDEAEPSLTLETACAGGKLSHGDAAGLVNIKRKILQLLRDLDDAVEIIRIDAAAAYLRSEEHTSELQSLRH